MRVCLGYVVLVAGGLTLAGHGNAAPMPQSGLPALRAPLRQVMAGLPALRIASPRPALGAAQVAEALALATLRADMARDVPGLRRLPPSRLAGIVLRARAMLEASHQTIDTPQLVLVVDRAPAAQTISVMLAHADGPWALVGTGRVSTGQSGRKEYYVTPLGAFAHTDAILDFRAEGTFNEHHVRGLGVAGMRVWDFGWQWAIKGWRQDGEGGDIRLQMHATDPDLLEQRLGRPASEGCVRVSSAMNRFLDHYGVLDADYERLAPQDVAVAALLRPDRTPTPLAGRLLIVVDSREPVGVAPTAASRPADWPNPEG